MAVGVIGGLIAGALGGCASPPSVTPLLRVAERAVREEACRVEGDIARDRTQVEASRRGLAAAYESDLAQRDELTPAWVLEATGVYVAAREALARHELALEAERRARADNLEAAADATRRAAEILEAQDALLTRVTAGVSVWELIRETSKEPKP